jgi:hypothetical protein
VATAEDVGVAQDLLGYGRRVLGGRTQGTPMGFGVKSPGA